jgi:membrane protease YdiL (CAAX protease family)
MPEAKFRTWKKIVFFYVLTLLFTSVFQMLDRNSPGNITIITGIMWCPALAAFATKWAFGESIRDLGWAWGSGRYQWWAYVIPLVYSLPVYLLVWLTGLGGFYDVAFVEKTAKAYALTGLPLGIALIVYVMITMTAGFVPKTGRALGEEIGWRGFLVPELAKVTGFTGVGLISGLMWAAWHFPSILFSDYNAGTPAWYAMTCFTVMVVAQSYIFAWLRLHSGSLWPAAFLHASHNMFVQLIFTPLTVDTGSTKYLVDEFGAGLAIASTIVAIYFWRRRGELPSAADPELNAQRYP